MKRRIPSQYEYDAKQVISAIRTIMPQSHIEIDSRGVIEVCRPEPTLQEALAIKAAVLPLLTSAVQDITQ